MTTIPAFVIVFFILWLVLKPRRPKPKINWESFLVVYRVAVYYKMPNGFGPPRRRGYTAIALVFYSVFLCGLLFDNTRKGNRINRWGIEWSKATFRCANVHFWICICRKCLIVRSYMHHTYSDDSRVLTGRFYNNIGLLKFCSFFVFTNSSSSQ